MTLVLKLDLDIIKMYVCTTFSSSEVIIWTDRQTETQTDLIEIITFRIADDNGILITVDCSNQCYKFQFLYQKEK